MDARVMVVGEAAGAQELQDGKPFVGNAGFLLNQCLKESGWDRKEMYITNVCRCRPCEGNKDRPPKQSEIKACAPFLHEEVDLLKPSMVILLGNTPLSAFTKKSKITESRGKPFEINGTIYFPTFHPSYILRMPAQRDVFVADLTRARNILDGNQMTPDDFDITLCLTEEQAKAEVAKAMEAESGAIDTETTSLYAWKSGERMLCLAVCYKEKSGFAVPATEWGLAAVKPFLECQEVKKVFHNAKFDTKWLEKHGVYTNHLTFDTGVCAHILNENRSLHLEDLAVEELGMKPWKAMATFKDFIGYEGTIQWLIDHPEEELGQKFLQLLKYNVIDAIVTFHLYLRLREKILKEPRFLNTFMRVAMPMVPTLRCSEQHGMMLDVGYVKELGTENEAKAAAAMALMEKLIPQSLKDEWERWYEDEQYKKYLEQVTTKKKADKLGRTVEEIAAERALEYIAKRPYVFDFNWNSGDQLAELLFESYGLGLTPVKFTETKKPSVDDEVLTALADATPLTKSLGDYRESQKLLTTYVRPWLENLDEDNRIHTHFNISGTKTGRLSSSDPVNLQNIPRGEKIRKAFIARPGWKIINCDFSQLELRVAAQVAPERSLRSVYQQGIDAHTATAAALTGKDLKDVTKQDRTLAKPVNFGLLYGMSAPGFKIYAKMNYGLELTDEEAVMFRNKFFQTYPDLVDWHNRMRMLILKNKFVDTVFGRRRRLIDAASPEQGKRNAAVREGTNMVVQSVASDIAEIAAADIHKVLDPDEAFIICLVHDSIMFEARDEVAETIGEMAQYMMENVDITGIFGYQWQVPLKVDVAIANSWGDCK